LALARRAIGDALLSRGQFDVDRRCCAPKAERDQPLRGDGAGVSRGQVSQPESGIFARREVRKSGKVLEISSDMAFSGQGVTGPGQDRVARRHVARVDSQTGKQSRRVDLPR